MTAGDKLTWLSCVTHPDNGEISNEISNAISFGSRYSLLFVCDTHTALRHVDDSLRSVVVSSISRHPGFTFQQQNSTAIISNDCHRACRTFPLPARLQGHHTDKLTCSDSGLVPYGISLTKLELILAMNPTFHNCFKRWVLMISTEDCLKRSRQLWDTELNITLRRARHLEVTVKGNISFNSNIFSCCHTWHP